MHNTSKTKWHAADLALCAMFIALIAVGAKIQITIPLALYSMHFTLQWLFVIFAGLVLGARLATASVGAYLIIGLAGLPIFATGGGFYYLTKPTFGYLLGFLFAAFVMGILTDKVKKLDFKMSLLISTVGLLIYYGVGMLYFFVMQRFVYGVPLGGAWAFLLTTFFSTVLEDFILCIGASVIAGRLRKEYRRVFPTH